LGSLFHVKLTIFSRFDAILLTRDFSR
jgi:hypothetical protein